MIPAHISQNSNWGLAEPQHRVVMDVLVYSPVGTTVRGDNEMETREEEQDTQWSPEHSSSQNIVECSLCLKMGGEKE